MKYDMNLMRTFLVVYETRSVTEAADLLFVSQPSVSYALSKLRRLFADQLFHRGASGFEATPAADRLYPQMRQAIQAMDMAVKGAAEFKPTVTDRRFRLMMTDLGLMVLFPYIIQAIERVAPNARLEVVRFDTATLREQLQRNEIDVAIGIPRYTDPDLVRDHLMDMPYVGVCAKTHPRIGSAPTIAQLSVEKHVFVSNSLGHEHVQQRLFEVGAGGHNATILPSFATVAQTLAVTEHVSVLPKALADVLVTQGAMKAFELPFSIEPGHVSQHTYKASVPSPAVEWLRAIIAEALIDYPYPKYVVPKDRD